MDEFTKETGLQDEVPLCMTFFLMMKCWLEKIWKKLIIGWMRDKLLKEGDCELVEVRQSI